MQGVSILQAQSGFHEEIGEDLSSLNNSISRFITQELLFGLGETCHGHRVHECICAWNIRLWYHQFC